MGGEIHTSFFERFWQNLERVDNVLKLYSSLNEDKKPLSPRDSDVLRASVVLLHASQEDYYRCVVTYFLAKTEESSALQKIPLCGLEGKDKFPLSELLRHRDKSVQALINDSVEEFMSNESFGNFGKISSWMKRISVSLSDFDKQSQIDSLTNRRHQIVHKADMNADGKRTQPIKRGQVETWRSAVVELISIIDDQIVELVDTNE